ncbi:hypothetical protein [Bacillus pumilus]|uniref:hypothetical protein n=1 Tax=Bacillus pumilus TaxID=1408 RepID=UPI0011A38F56|nr:hypothetical protein [Bacillus pumilus]
MKFLKKSWKYIVVAIVAMFIGSAMSGSSPSKASEKLKKENETLQKKVDELAPYAKLAEADAKEKMEKIEKKKEEEAKAKAKKEEEKKKEELAKKKAEEQEKKGYDTGITYDQLARTPEKYKGKKVKFKGEVVQVMEGDGTTEIRVAVDEYYNDIVYGAYQADLVKSRVLEGDVITFMGTSEGVITYESTTDGNITIPSVNIEKIEN